MYGYVRPERGELKVKEYEAFQGVYCGLCHELRRRYGPVGRFLVNYDFTFLAMLLAGPEDGIGKACRCPYHPFRKRRCTGHCDALAVAADDSVILGYWKLQDGIADKGFPGRLFCRLGCLVLRRPYKKASAGQPVFAQVTEEAMAELRRLEEERCDSLDAVADTFARMLQAAGESGGSETRCRILKELLYHLGRIIYILDAVDDLKDDAAQGRYDPLLYRFQVQDGALSPEDEAQLRLTLQLSHNDVSSAFELLDTGPYTGILANTIYYGLPGVTQAVFSGAWHPSGRLKRNRSTL